MYSDRFGRRIWINIFRLIWATDLVKYIQTDLADRFGKCIQTDIADGFGQTYSDRFGGGFGIQTNFADVFEQTHSDRFGRRIWISLFRPIWLKDLRNCIQTDLAV